MHLCVQDKLQLNIAVTQSAVSQRMTALRNINILILCITEGYDVTNFPGPH